MDLFFNLFKIRFNVMETLISNCCSNLKKGSEVVVHINLEPVIRKMISSGVNDELKVRTDERILELISCIFNLAAHYRLFFSKHKLYSRVYMYYGFPCDANYINREINPEYRNNSIDLMCRNPKTSSMRLVLNEAIPMLKTIFEYIDGVYFIESNNIEPSLMPYINYKENEDKVHFLISNDKYEYQYANLNNFYILRPKQENSYILYKCNVIEQMKYESKIVNDLTVKSEMVSFILSILGNENRNIPKIKRMGLASILKLLNKGVNEGIISDNVNNIFILNRVIKDEYVEQITNNYLCTDLDSQYNKLKSKDIYHYNDQLIDKFDNKQLRKLNDQYFNRYPLYIMEIQSALKLKQIERIKF